MFVPFIRRLIIMISYNGEKCIVCESEFTDSDDIVVCPDCGTPYHRECYREKNGCINHELHESGGSWMAESFKMKIKKDAVKKVCPDCSFINPQDAEKCRNCGSDFSGRECRKIDLSDDKVVRIELDADADYFGMNPMEIMDEGSGITIGEMADYAKNNKLYYMLSFRRLKKAAVKFSLNFFAFFFPEFYCASRKMYPEAIAVLILRFILQIPSYFEVISQMDTMGFPYAAGIYSNLIKFASDHAFSSSVVNTANSLDVALRVVFSLLANQIYFRHTVTKLKKLRKQVPDYLKYRTVIKTSGGISVVAVVGMVLIQMFLVSTMIFVLMLLA